jgi:hypothetical protein
VIDHDLFSTAADSAAVALASAPSEDAQPVTQPDPYGIQELNASHAALRRALGEATATLQPALATVLDQAPYQNSGDSLRSLLSALAIREADLEERLWHIGVHALCTTAEVQFRHPSGAPLVIRRDEVWEALGEGRSRHRGRSRFDEDDAQEPTRAYPSFDAVWAHLAATFGTTAAADALEDEVVRTFIDAFLRRHRKVEAPTWRRGCLLLTHSLYTEKKFSGGYEVSYSTREYLAKSITALGNMLKVVGGQDLAAGLQRCHLLQGYGVEVVSRERHPLPQDSAYITYLQKLELEIGPTVAADLMARVSEYFATHGTGDN